MNDQQTSQTAFTTFTMTPHKATHFCSIKALPVTSLYICPPMLAPQVVQRPMVAGRPHWKQKHAIECTVWILTPKLEHSHGLTGDFHLQLVNHMYDSDLYTKADRTATQYSVNYYTLSIQPEQAVISNYPVYSPLGMQKPWTVEGCAQAKTNLKSFF